MTSATGHGEHGADGAERWRRGDELLGTLCLAFGVIAAVAFLWLLSLNLEGFNPPNWIRIVGVAGLPVGIAGAVLTGLLGRRGPQRGRALAGLGLAALTVVGFVVLVATADY